MREVEYILDHIDVDMGVVRLEVYWEGEEEGVDGDAYVEEVVGLGVALEALKGIGLVKRYDLKTGRCEWYETKYGIDLGGTLMKEIAVREGGIESFFAMRNVKDWHWMEVLLNRDYYRKMQN